MYNRETRNKERGDLLRTDWVWEVLIFLTIIPAVVFGILSLGNLPIA